MNLIWNRGSERRIALSLFAAMIGGASAFAVQQGAGFGSAAGAQSTPVVRLQEGTMVRPDVGLAASPPRKPQGPRTVHGEVRLAAIHQPFEDATIVVTLRKVVGPTADAYTDRIAEVRFFHVTKRSADQKLFLPFTFGDFYPRPDATYTLEAYLDVNRNGRQDAGDYWNQRRVEVMGPSTPDRAILEDFAPLVEAQ